MWQLTILNHYEYGVRTHRCAPNTGQRDLQCVISAPDSTSTHEYVLTFSRRYREAEAGLRDVGAALHRSVDVM